VDVFFSSESELFSADLQQPNSLTDLSDSDLPSAIRFPDSRLFQIGQRFRLAAALPKISKTAILYSVMPLFPSVPQAKSRNRLQDAVFFYDIMPPNFS